jgi:hypothetical protein
MKIFKSTIKILEYSNHKLKIEIPECDDSVFAYFYHNLQNVSEFELELMPPFKHRSTGYKSQNHRINGFVMQLANHTGYSFDELKYWIKQQSMSEGYPSKYAPNGDLMPISESEASVQDAIILIGTIERIAAELNFVLKEK